MPFPGYREGVAVLSREQFDSIEFDAAASGDHAAAARQMFELAIDRHGDRGMPRAEAFLRRAGEQWLLADEPAEAVTGFRRAMADGGPVFTDPRVPLARRSSSSTSRPRRRPYQPGQGRGPGRSRHLRSRCRAAGGAVGPGGRPRMGDRRRRALPGRRGARASSAPTTSPSCASCSGSATASATTSDFPRTPTTRCWTRPGGLPRLPPQPARGRR